MSLDKGMPGRHPLGRLGIMGTPYHGLVQGGELTLPNDDVKEYPQPVTTWPDLAGATHLLRRPGMPAVSRTTEQEAADTANGYQWRNVAMLSGGLQQLYGKDVDGWIYIDPDGVRWRISFTTSLQSITVTFGTPLILQSRVTRFGEFGGTPQTFLTTLTLTDWGQNGYPALPAFANGGPATNVTSAGFNLEAITTNGARAAICVRVRRTESEDPADPTVDVAVRHSLGWLELSITSVDGLPVLSLAVLKNRAETLITVVNSGASTPAADSVEPPLISGRGTTTVKTGSSTREHEFQRLIAVWVNPETEAWRWVSMRYRYQADTLSTFEGAVGNSYVVAFEAQSVESMAIEIDDVEQVKLELELTRESSRAMTYTEESDPEYFGLTLLEFLGGESAMTVDGAEYSESSPPAPISTSAAPETNVTLDIGNYGSGSSLAYADSVVRQILYQMQWRFQTTIALSTPEPYRIKLDLCRQSSQVVTLRYHVLSGTVDEFTYFERVTPGGLSGSKITRPYSATERLFGSWCPHTGAVSDMQASPVCWV